MFVPHNCANCVCRNERASCFLAPRIMFVLVFWARVLHHICLRMHIHTRVYVTKNELHAHGHARRHMCRSSVAGLGPQAPCGIRRRLLTNPEPHTWFLRALRPLHLAPGSWQGAGPEAMHPPPAQAQAEHRPDLHRHRHFQHEHRPRPAGRRPRKQGPIMARAQTLANSSSSSAGTASGHAQQQDKAKRATAKSKQSGAGMSQTGFVSRDTVNAERDCTRLYTNAEGK